MKKLLEENETLTQIVVQRHTPEPGRIHQSISQFFSSKNTAKSLFM